MTYDQRSARAVGKREQIALINAHVIHNQSIPEGDKETQRIKRDRYADELHTLHPRRPRA